MRSQEFKCYANSILSPSHYRILDLIDPYTGIKTTTLNISEELGIVRATLQRAFVSLRKKGFLLYQSNQNGIIVVWVRKSISEKPPTIVGGLRGFYKVANPEGEILKIPRGLIPSFCKQNNLNSTSFRGLVSGRCQSYRGYKLLEVVEEN